MKCGDTRRHNISKLNSRLSVKLLQLPLQGSGKALGNNLEGACSIFLAVDQSENFNGYGQRCHFTKACVQPSQPPRSNLEIQ